MLFEDKSWVLDLPYALQRHWRRVVLSLLAGACLAVAGAASLGLRYTAEARLMMSGGDQGQAARNEAEMLRDPSIMRGFAPLLARARPPQPRWQRAAMDRLRRWRLVQADNFAGDLARAVTVEAVPGTDIITLRFHWDDPVFAARALNLLLRDQQSLASGHEEASETYQIAQSRVTDAAAALRRIEAQIAALPSVGGVAADAGAIEREKDRVASRSTAARAAMESLKVERDLQAKKLDAAEKAYAGGGWVDNADAPAGGQMMDPAFMDLLEKRGNLLAKATPDLAKVQELDHQIAAAREHAFMGVRNGLAGRLSGIDTQLSAATAGLQADERELRALDDRLVQIEALQNSRMLAEGQADSAERALEEARHHAEQAMREAAGLRVLSEAVPPLSPDFPSPALLLLAGCFAGLGLGVTWAAWAERHCITIDRPQDIARVLRLPVLASLPELR